MKGIIHELVLPPAAAEYVTPFEHWTSRVDQSQHTFNIPPLTAIKEKRTQLAVNYNWLEGV